MRSELLPVARKSNESNEIGRVATFFGDRVSSENAPGATKVRKTPLLCRMMNVVELAFSEVRRAESRIDTEQF
jgi:hypothetical protein